MNRQTILMLLVATVAMVGASIALVSINKSRSPAESTGVGEPLFPGLKERINDVARVELTQQANSTSLEIGEGGVWTLLNRDGYPAKFENIKELVVSVASLTKYEMKTADPALYPRIKVDEPNPDSIATKVLLKDKEGKQIAGLIIGDYPTTGGDSRFVRPVNQPQSWLAKGKVSASADPMAWLDREVIKVTADDVKSVSVTRAAGDNAGNSGERTTGESVRIARELGEAGPMRINPSIPGRKAKDAATLNRLAGALAFVSLSDVRADDGAWAEATDRVVTRFECIGGYAVEVTTWSETTPEDPAGAAALSVSVENGAGTKTHWAVLTPLLLDHVSDGEVATGEAAAGDPGAGVPDPAARIDEIDLKVAGWAYKIDAGKFDALRLGVEQLTVPGEDAPPGQPVGPLGPAAGEPPTGSQPSLLNIPPSGGP